MKIPFSPATEHVFFGEDLRVGQYLLQAVKAYQKLTGLIRQVDTTIGEPAYTLFTDGAKKPTYPVTITGPGDQVAITTAYLRGILMGLGAAKNLVGGVK